MITCAACSSANRIGARFCWNCAAPLESITRNGSPTASPRPTTEDMDWLAATLAHDESSYSMPHAATRPTTPLLLPDGYREEIMDQPQSDNPNLFGGRYEVIAEDDHGIVEVLDHEPWRRCWACDSLANEAHESFVSIAARPLKAYLSWKPDAQRATHGACVASGD